MKNAVGGILICLGVALGIFTFLQNNATVLDEQTIYFFTKPGCPYCERAESYIKQTHPNLTVEYKNVKEASAMRLMSACAEKFNLPQNRLGTPLICMGNSHILGWSQTAPAEFERALKTMK